MLRWCRQLGMFLFLLVQLEVATIAMAQTIGTQSPLQGQSSRVEFNKSMVYIIALLIFIFSILGFISVYTRRCVDSHLRAHLGYRNFPFGVISSRRGLPPPVINTFPTFIYSAAKGVKIGKGSVECAVCLNVFEEDETLRLIPICNHVFHSQCIDVWLGSHSTCPICRADLLSKDGGKASVAITIQGSGHEPDEPDRRSELDHEIQNQATVGMISSPGGDHNQNRLPRSLVRVFRLSSLFSRSHSTGHSSRVQNPNEDHERFTLRLPEEARDQSVNASPNRTQSYVTLAGESCPRKGYRSGGGEEDSDRVGRKDLNENRFDQEERADKLRFTLASSFFNKNRLDRDGS